MGKMTVHWHLSTSPHPNTPNYPDKGARHIYLTACALRLDSLAQNKTYELDQFNQSRVDCNRCLIWLSWYNELATSPSISKKADK